MNSSFCFFAHLFSKMSPYRSVYFVVCLQFVFWITFEFWYTVPQVFKIPCFLFLSYFTHLFPRKLFQGNMCYVCVVTVELFSPEEASCVCVCVWPCRALLTDMVGLFWRHTALLSAETLYRLVIKFESNQQNKTKMIKLIISFGPWTPHSSSESRMTLKWIVDNEDWHTYNLDWSPQCQEPILTKRKSKYSRKHLYLCSAQLRWNSIKVVLV